MHCHQGAEPPHNPGADTVLTCERGGVKKKKPQGPVGSNLESASSLGAGLMVPKASAASEESLREGSLFLF